MNYDDEVNADFHQQHHNQYNPYQEPNQNHYYSSAYYTHGSSPPPITNLLFTLREWFQKIYSNSPHVIGGVVIAVLVVALVHYRDKIERTIRGEEHHRQRHTFRDLTSMPWLDYLWISLMSCFEVIVRLRLFLISSSSEIMSTNNGSGRRRNTLRERQEITDTGRGLRMRFRGDDGQSLLPGLEEVDNSPPSTTEPKRWNNSEHCEEIEPAFLSVDEYPEGWLVYDRVFGVIPKKLSDKWRGGNRSDKEEEKKETNMIPKGENPSRHHLLESTTETLSDQCPAAQ